MALDQTPIVCMCNWDRDSANVVTGKCMMLLASWNFGRLFQVRPNIYPPFVYYAGRRARVKVVAV